MDWIAIGLCADVPANTVVPRQVFGVDLALWCSAAGVYHVWGDRCPHRGMRLSHGFVRGETLACIYHGWQYDNTGACHYIPAHPKLTPPKTICAQGHECRARDALVWVALQDTQADVPDVGERQPVRSLDMALSAEALAHQLDQPLAPVMAVGGPFDVALAVQPRNEKSCFVHALAAAEQDRKTVSRHLEDMRHDLEASA